MSNTSPLPPPDAAAASLTSAPCPNAGRGLGCAKPAKPSCGQLACQAKWPRQTMTRSEARSCASSAVSHSHPEQPLPIPGSDAGRLDRKAAAPEGGEQDVAAAIPGEDPPGAVPAVRGRRQADDEHRGLLRTPAGD